ncbi:MAG: NAD/NADP octopine/nopaline dehydrogenase family protein [Anaerolineales bacterium]|nr:NAD/NADP octopine/nopaline dehydrogenase family protein [Anaerolineales bacterium]
MGKNFNYAVIGAGNGGKAMASHLAIQGYQVSLFNRTAEKVNAIEEMGGIHLTSYEDGPKGFGPIKLVTSDMSTAIKDARLIMVVVPSSAHRDIAVAMAPHLKNGQMVILHPGRTCGAIEFHQVLHAQGCTADVTIAEAETFIYASRSEGPAKARIFRIKDAVPLAALPATRTREVLGLVKEAYPEFIDGINVLHTGLNNMGAIFHPALTLLNAGRIESTMGEFQFYIEGVTASTARVLEVLDRERVTVAAAIGVRARTALEWLDLAYNVQGEDLYQAIHNQTGYHGIKAPSTLAHRYIFEDIPMSLVPISALAKRYGVSVRGMDAIIRLACIIHRTDYWRRGRTLDKLGIEELSVSELTRYVNEGIDPRI